MASNEEENPVELKVEEVGVLQQKEQNEEEEEEEGEQEEVNDQKPQNPNQNNQENNDEEEGEEEGKMEIKLNGCNKVLHFGAFVPDDFFIFVHGHSGLRFCSPGHERIC